MYSRNESLATPPATAPIKEWEPACQHEQLTGSRVDEELEVWGGVLHLDAVGHEQVSSQVSLLLVSSCLLFLNKTYCHSTCAFIGTGKNESLFPENQTKKKKKGSKTEGEWQGYEVQVLGWQSTRFIGQEIQQKQFFLFTDKKQKKCKRRTPLGLCQGKCSSRCACI